MDIKKHIKILKAMSDPARLRLLKLLSEKELCVCEIEEVMNVKQSTVSHQLRRLKDAGLVIERKDGWKSYCSLDHVTVNDFIKDFKDFFLPPGRSYKEDRGGGNAEHAGREEKTTVFRKKEFID
ncbi:MAG: metalloregulator ArsR/SmtB family transcription factor [Candidatus Eremiobacterota bacterium]